MTTTPEACRAEQERVLKLLDKTAPEPWGIGSFRRYAVFSLHPDASRTAVVMVRHSEGDNEPMDGEAQANLQLCAAAPTLTRQYAALLAAHAEALERLERAEALAARMAEMQAAIRNLMNIDARHREFLASPEGFESDDAGFSQFRREFDAAYGRLQALAPAEAPK